MARKRLISKLKRFHRLRYALPALVVVGAFGLVGTIREFSSHAETPDVYTIQSKYPGDCMDDFHGGQTVGTIIDIDDCNGTTSQEFNVNDTTTDGNIQFNNGLCVGPLNNGTAQSTKVVLTSCSGDEFDEWSRDSEGHLINTATGQCLTATTNAQYTQLVDQTCVSGPHSSQVWTYAASAPPVPATVITSPASGATVGGSGVTVSGQASVSSGTITSLTIKAGSTTLHTCTNSTTCSTTWNTTSVGNGTYIVQISTTASGGGSSQASESVKVNNQAASSPAPGGGGGSSGGSGGGSTGSGSGSGSGGGSSGGSGSIPFDSSGDSTDSVSIGSDGSGGSDDSSLGVLQTPDDSLGLTGSSTVTGPTVFDILADKITSNSIALSWQAANANVYVLKYGTNSDDLSHSTTVKSTAADPKLTLTKLPSNTRIYVAITPKKNNSTGATVSTSFQTIKSSNPLGTIIAWVIFLILAIICILLFKRKLQRMRSSGEPTTNIDQLPAYPQEDSATQADRLNWWMSDSQKQNVSQQAQSRQGGADDIPDMYDEGRKRLDDERGDRQ